MDGNAGLGEVKPGLARSASKVAALGARAGGVAACGGVWDAYPHEEWPGQHASWRVRVQGSQLAASMQWTKFTGAVRLR